LLSYWIWFKSIWKSRSCH